MKKIVYLVALFLTMGGSAAWAEKNTVEISPKAIRINNANYHRINAESACLGCLGIKRDLAHPSFEDRLYWSELGAEELEIVEEVVIQMDADMESEWKADFAASKDDNEANIEGGGGQSLAASYTLQKMEIINPGNLVEMINDSDHGQSILSALRSKNHLGIRIITAVWVLIEGHEEQGRHFSMSGGASGEGKGTQADGSGGGGAEHNVAFTLNAGTIMAYEMSTIDTKKCGRGKGKSGPHKGRHCEAISVEVDKYIHY